MHPNPAIRLHPSSFPMTVSRRSALSIDRGLLGIGVDLCIENSAIVRPCIVRTYTQIDLGDRVIFGLVFPSTGRVVELTHFALPTYYLYMRTASQGLGKIIEVLDDGYTPPWLASRRPGRLFETVYCETGMAEHGEERGRAWTAHLNSTLAVNLPRIWGLTHSHFFSCIRMSRQVCDLSMYSPPCLFGRSAIRVNFELPKTGCTGGRGPVCTSL